MPAPPDFGRQAALRLCLSSRPRLYSPRFQPGDPTIPTPPDAYRRAGVDIAAGNDLVRRIAPLAAATARPGAGAGLGGFGAVFDPRAAGYTDPLLVATTDGVGTKLLVATAVGRHDTVGIDLVAMCVNDLLVQGAEPLVFLDYFATARLDPAHAAEVISGVAAACRAVGCALIGGETAEMPGLYHGDDYDLAGFAVGAVERGALLPRPDVAAGDVVLGLASSGVHSNGFSLVRRLVADLGLAYGAPAPFAPEQTLGDALLTPTRLYGPAVLPQVRAGRIKALAHITGGGLAENIPRVLATGLGVTLRPTAWTPAPVFGWLAATGKLSAAEMARTFNCGLGLIAVVACEHAAAVAAELAAAGETVAEVGTVEPAAEGAAPVSFASPLMFERAP